MAMIMIYYKRGRGLIKINDCPIELVESEILRFNAFEPIVLISGHRLAGIDMRIQVKGGGHTSQIYEAVAMIKPIQDPEQAAKRLMQEACERGSADNITCVVVRFLFDQSSTNQGATSPSLSA
ncbi:40S ribosomal protein S16 [Hibiscus syriacus]|uniref:40S ribosomal protein S16 n=1 Tax=Hibiscus syriacus TaxID=106335 RepID=A0A6A2XKD4_HIBSY|nr:40S ribosomal protein S16 [Hibiscus syriacus]